MKKILSVLICILFFLLSACKVEELKIIGIDNVGEVIGNHEERNYNIIVSFTTEIFSTEQIKVNQTAEMTAYQDSALLQELPKEIPLIEGMNSFYIVLKTSKETAQYTFYITREENPNPAISLTEDNIQKEYFIGDAFGPATVVVTYKDGTKVNKEILPHEVEGYSSHVVGKQIVTLHCEKLTLNIEIEIMSENGKLIGIEIVELKSNYLRDEEFKEGKLKLIYDNKEEEIIDLLYDFIIDFDTSKIGEREITIIFAGFSLKYKISVLER